MEHLEATDEFTANYEQLKTSAGRTSNWRERLEAVEALGQWNNQQTIAILTHRLNNDAVFKVQEAAYSKLKEWGEDVQPPVRKKGDLIKGVSKILVRIKKSLPKDHTFEEFKQKLKNMRLDIYDIYEGDKGAEFDSWLESTWASLSTGRP
ncbi:HEAT repeat domain-containing protein [Paenibacillus sp. y28]|uniref:HEAT repeat domain-containing protein n=1 Tax=Paenibacillus sp. y28 TaxID=3129110 RepID=UPI003FA68211